MTAPTAQMKRTVTCSKFQVTTGQSCNPVCIRKIIDYRLEKKIICRIGVMCTRKIIDSTSPSFLFSAICVRFALQSTTSSDNSSTKFVRTLTLIQIFWYTLDRGLNFYFQQSKQDDTNTLSSFFWRHWNNILAGKHRQTQK